MADYSEKQRKEYATVKGGKFPIGDKAHARAALARLNQAKPPLSHDQKMTVIRRAHAMLRGKH